MIQRWWAAHMNLENQINWGAGGEGSVGGVNEKEMMYAPWRYVNDIYQLSSAEATAPVMFARGEATWGYAKPNTGQEVPGFGRIGDTSEKYRYRGDIVKTGGTKDDVRTLRDAMNWAQRLDEGQMGQFTRALYAAGFYHDSQYSKGANPPGGKVFDDQAQYAAMSLYKEVVKYNAANPQNQKTMTEILQERINAGMGQSKIDEGGKASPGQVYQITTSDPATLRETVTRVAQTILGRAVNDKERDALVNRMIEAEKAPQMAAVNAGQTAEGGSDVILQQARVDAEARMKESLESENAVEAQAFAESNYAGILDQMLKGQG